MEQRAVKWRGKGTFKTLLLCFHHAQDIQVMDMSYIKIVVLMIDRWCLFGCLALWDP